MDCLIVVDAWESCSESDLDIYPYLGIETKIFGQYLNHMLTMIRPHCEVFHHADGRPIMKEIDVKQDIVINNMTQLPSFDHYYFCGFHLGRCIYKKMKQLNKNNIGVVMNMSMIFPEDVYKDKISELESNNGYMYSHAGGFEKCAIHYF